LDTDFATEAEAHEYVLSSIRSGALRSLEPASSSASVLDLVREGEAAVRAAEATAMGRLRQLPRAHRRTVERILFGRPAMSVESIARSEGVSARVVEARFDDALRQVAAGFGSSRDPARDGEPHLALPFLVAYVEGSLTGEQARDVAKHCHRCRSCGDRLGTLMLLRAAAGESVRVPLVSKSTVRAGAVALVLVTLAGGALVVDGMLPNPWKDHATSETVPRWFYEFFQRSDSWASGDSAAGLALLVEGRVDEAIERLEPVVREHPEDAEAASYLGVARFLSGDTSRGTVRLLELGTSSFRAGRLARWYLANVWLARGDVDSAIVHLEELAATGDWFGRSAKALLRKLEELKRAQGERVNSVARR
jgi:hypothetical protein